MTSDTPAIAVVPYGKWPNFGIADVPLDDLVWPLGRPERLASGTIRDMGPDDHLITFPRAVVFYLPWIGVKANISVMIVEPELAHRKHIFAAWIMGRRFWQILTKNRGFIDRIRNSAFFPFGSSFISTPAEIDTRKVAQCSLIASAKTQMEGHCETVPIYWGAPDIAEYFEVQGMIVCESAEDIKRAFGRMSETDYEGRANAIATNRVAALHWADLFGRAAQLIEASLPVHRHKS